MIKKVVTLIIKHKSSIIMQLRDNKSDILYPNRWGFFSGSLKKGEDPRHAAIRELKEELGNFCIKKIKYNFSYFQANTKSMHYVFTVIPNIKNLVLGEGADYEFFYYHDFMKYSKKSKKMNAVFKIAEDEVVLKFYKKLLLTIM